MQEYSNLGHTYPPRQEAGQYHQMKSVDPNQIPLVKTLNNDISKISINSREAGPQLGLSTSIPVNRALSNVVHAVFGVFVLVLGRFGGRVGGIGGVDSGGGIVDRAYVV